MSLFFHPTYAGKYKLIKHAINAWYAFDLIFSPLELDFEDTQSILGVTGKMYVAGDFFLDNGTKYPQQECFVPENEKLISGVRDVSKCKYVSNHFSSLLAFFFS